MGNPSQSLIAAECHLPYGITQCYLPSDTGECALPWPQAHRLVLDLPTSEGQKAELTLMVVYNTEIVYLPADSHPSR